MKTELINYGTRSKEATPLQADLSGIYHMSYRTLEMKPFELATPPDPRTRQVYSIRIGTKNKSLIYVNHRDRTSVSTTCQYQASNDPDFTKVVFQYSIHKYSFLLEPENMLTSDEVVGVIIERV